MRRVAVTALAEALEKVGPPTAVRVADFEETTKHEVMAFLLALDERIRALWREETESELRQWLHYGLTSSDVTDTALGLALKGSHEILAQQGCDLMIRLGEVCQSLRDRPQVMGRTHGQYARTMVAPHRWLVLYSMLVTAVRKLMGARTDLLVGKLSGPVGDDDFTGIETLRGLGLGAVPSTQVVPRVGLAHWAHCLAEIATVCEAVATQVWLLAQQEVGEVSEDRTPEQVGSSAMPHKTNPIRSENIRGLARLVRMNAEVLQTTVVQWGEHDLSHSCVERVALPDLCHLSAAILTRTTALVSGLEFHVDPTGNGFVDTHQKLMDAQQAGEPYVVAHQRLQASYLDGKIPGMGTDDAEDLGWRDA